MRIESKYAKGEGDTGCVFPFQDGWRMMMEKMAAAYIRQYGLDQILEEQHQSMLELKIYKRRDILLHADAKLQHLLFLVKGKAKTSYISANGQTILHSFLYPLSILGEVELWKQMPVLNEVEALCEVIVLQLPLVRCEQSLRQDVRFLQYLVSELSEKLKNSNRNASISLSYPVENRLASYLMAVCEQDEFKEDHGEVSSLIGCSYRQLQRCLAQFCEQGLLCKCEKGVYRINNRKQLQALGRDIYGGIAS